MTSTPARRQRAAMVKNMQKDLAIHRKVEARRAAKLEALAAAGKEPAPTPAADLLVVKRDELKMSTTEAPFVVHHPAL